MIPPRVRRVAQHPRAAPGGADSGGGCGDGGGRTGRSPARGGGGTEGEATPFPDGSREAPRYRLALIASGEAGRGGGGRRPGPDPPRASGARSRALPPQPRAGSAGSPTPGSWTYWRGPTPGGSDPLSGRPASGPPDSSRGTLWGVATRGTASRACGSKPGTTPFSFLFRSLADSPLAVANPSPTVTNDEIAPGLDPSQTSRFMRRERRKGRP